MDNLGGADGPSVSHSFAAIAQHLYVSEDVDETLEAVAAGASRAIPGCDVASITLLEDGRLRTPAATDPRAVAADELQYSLQQGPCYTAVTSEMAVYTPDLSTDERWPQFSRRAAELGFGSLLSYRLMARGESTLGSINLYGLRPQSFSEQSRHFGAMFAAFTGAMAHAARRHTGLLDAIQSRDVIGQAKGILMERHRVTAEEAFDTLRIESQRLNVKLRDLAAHLSATGELPGSGQTPRALRLDSSS
ncbi:MAG: hypothetical protein QOK43_1278 [Acidimicrobiaceae bacterium]|nr:hypothetical protein [Acidimicrobiaceae bacterium]